MTNNKTLITILAGVVTIFGLTTWMACNKGFDRVLQDKDYTDTTSAVSQNPHVLYIVIDGARGQSVRDAQPPNILSLTDHAIYSWNTVTDTTKLDMSTWADLLTGVTKDKHKVLSPDLSQSNLSTYPVFFNYIKERRPDFRVTAFSSSDSLKSLISGADVNESFGGDDAAVTQAAVAELNTDSSRLVFVQFNDVDTAGATFGYDLSVPEYKAAILKTDEYIGQLLDAIHQHKNFAEEDWMVVITSNRGGPFTIPPEDDDHTVLSDPTVNGFMIFYSPRFQPNFIDKPYTGNRYTGSEVELTGSDPATASYAVIGDKTSDFDFADTVEFTIEMKIKVKENSDGSNHSFSAYPSLLSKRTSFDRGVAGWTFWLHDRHWAFLAEQTNGFTEAQGPDISDGTWHDIAVVVENRSGHRYARIYTDGNYNKEADITVRGNLNSTAPMTLGYLPGIGAGTIDNVFISELKIWRAALDDETIGKFACETTLPDDHPYNDYLLGYWPCTDGQGGAFTDHGTLQHDLVLQGDYQWDTFNDLICAPSSSNLAELMPQPVDVVGQILNWLQIAADPVWNLDGRLWTTKYVGVKQ